MTEGRGASLLDLAIVAGAAVVPVLLGVLLAAGAFSESEPARGRERYVSVRHVAALKTFEHAVVRRDRVTAGPPDAAMLLDKLPACRDAWGARASLRERIRRLWTDDSDTAPLPAQRVAAHLAALDRALARFSGSDNRRVSEPVGFDAERWFDAAAHALHTPVEAPEYPGRRFELRCADLAAAANALARSDGRMLDTLAWRGTAVAQVLARWRPDQFVEISSVQVARDNPWGGLPGCVYLGGAASAPAYFVAPTRGDTHRLCALPAMAGTGPKARPPQPIAGEPGADTPPDDPRWSVPPSLDVMLRPLQPLQRPSGALYRAYTDASSASASPTAYRHGPNRLTLDGRAVNVGFTVDLTIDPAAQALAQKTVACYTGRQDPCRELGIRRREDGSQAIGRQMLEQAVVRMAAVAIVDVESGRIEALAGALSPCTREGYDGPGLNARCDRRLPYRVEYRPDALLNAAVFHDAMPASVIKPIMAAEFLGEAGTGTQGLAAELARSDSPRFLDRMFCAERGFAGCERPAQVQAAALALGWSGGCSGRHEGCGKRDLLFGRSADATAEAGRIQPLSMFVPYGRLLAEPADAKPGAPFRLMPPTLIDAEPMRRCAAGPDGTRPSGDDWKKCQGASVVGVVAEGWGQGHARASALGGAGMMAALAAAANGQSMQRAPHLVSALRGVGSGDAAKLESAVLRWSLAPPQPVRASRDAAAVILDGLSRSHRGGSAQPACEQVFDARKCREIDWIAGKTGTPSFPSDARSLDDLARLCAPGAARRDPACRSLRPYKWYVAAYRTDRNGGRWTKAIGVLTERNWLAGSGRIQGAGDHGPNPAAEIAMQITGRQAGLLGEGAP